jgi:hypothetical protein
VREATHEAVPYYFHDLVPPVLAWLDWKIEESERVTEACKPGHDAHEGKK